MIREVNFQGEGFFDVSRQDTVRDQDEQWITLKGTWNFF